MVGDVVRPEVDRVALPIEVRRVAGEDLPQRLIDAGLAQPCQPGVAEIVTGECTHSRSAHRVTEAERYRSAL